jgi:hypothetical protein
MLFRVGGEERVVSVTRIDDTGEGENGDTEDGGDAGPETPATDGGSNGGGDA